MTAQPFTQVTPGDQVRFYQLDRWLHPFARERATLFTRLNPDEIRDRLWPYWDHAYEPDGRKELRQFADGLVVFLAALPGMTGEERASRLEDLGRILRDGGAVGVLLQGTAHPGGFKLWNETNESVSLRATYRTETHGTTLDVDVGPDSPARRLESLILSLIPAWAVLSITLTGFLSPSSSLLPTVLFRLFL